MFWFRDGKLIGACNDEGNIHVKKYFKDLNDSINRYCRNWSIVNNKRFQSVNTTPELKDEDVFIDIPKAETEWGVYVLKDGKIHQIDSLKQNHVEIIKIDFVKGYKGLWEKHYLYRVSIAISDKKGKKEFSMNVDDCLFFLFTEFSYWVNLFIERGNNAVDIDERYLEWQCTCFSFPQANEQGYKCWEDNEECRIENLYDLIESQIKTKSYIIGDEVYGATIDKPEYDAVVDVTFPWKDKYVRKLVGEAFSRKPIRTEDGTYTYKAIRLPFLSSSGANNSPAEVEKENQKIIIKYLRIYTIRNFNIEKARLVNMTIE